MTSIDQDCPLVSPEIPNAWEQASIVARYVEVCEARRKFALRLGRTEKQALDYGQVAAWLDKEARADRLRIWRTRTDDGSIFRHYVFLLKEKDGEPILEIGGWCPKAEFQELHERHIRDGDEIVEGYCRVRVMITDIFPDHTMFKRSDGTTPIDLGAHDAHFYLFTVDIPKQNVNDHY